MGRRVKKKDQGQLQLRYNAENVNQGD